MENEKRYLCEYQLYPDFEWSAYGSVCNWTNALENYARHVSQYPTEAVRIREVELIKRSFNEFIPAGYEEKGQ